ncbi:SAM-dependent methyltransferase [Chromobacterium phragmitis]|uniref:SAM-dependent methyltransferase n=1 Tax=Chromobacterium phragmitis TaxID=2202141 RepID=A0A344UDY5_9NEIS|nr:class I SAM-dependent methyltransferase [Chromobacterium phragmitis]AXE32096.1 SAM-dependent methyltransferase [Chromobacterium phragmitis]AXE33483.1 SAM-dependent methyltransferase [Chromobacterium phragmitis]
MAAVHGRAQAGFAKEAQAYERGRPEYAWALTDWLERELGLGADSVALDLGAGTGKFTRLLTGVAGEAIAVEPVAEMRAQLQESLPGTLALAGTAEGIPLPDGAVDAVVCAQAFHWFASETALAEIHRVLKPGGSLGLVWNVRDESCAWVAEITRLMAPHEGDTPRFRSGAWRRPFEAGRYFAAPALTMLPHTHAGPPDRVIVDRFLSVSFIAALPDDEKRRFAEALRRLIATHPDLRGREEVAFPYRTEAYRCARL